tara:strand:- start:5675 stop:11638 length:5964 start_codon:yes stop_codon:yes gene_type:complete
MDRYTLEDYDTDLYNFDITTQLEPKIDQDHIEARDYNSHKFIMPKETKNKSKDVNVYLEDDSDSDEELTLEQIGGSISQEAEAEVEIKTIGDDEYENSLEEGYEDNIENHLEEVDDENHLEGGSNNESTAEISNNESIEIPSTTEDITESEVETEAEDEAEDETDRLPSEFIMNDEDFEIIEQEGIVIREETLIPEYKVITSEEEQIADLLNELIKKVPERYREDKITLKNINKIVNNNIQLKKHFSVYDENNDIVEAKLLTSNYKPLLDKMGDNDFSNKTFVPVVAQKKVIYKIESIDKEGEIVESINEDQVATDNVLNNNSDIIKKQVNIRNKYKKTAARRNYSYRSEINETYDSIYDTIQNSSDSQGYYTTFKKNTCVYSNCFDESDVQTYSNGNYINKQYTKTILPGELNTLLDPQPLVKGTSTNIIGMIQMPSGLNDKSYYLSEPLYNLNEYNYNVEKSFNFDKAKLETVNTSLTIDTRVKICLTLDGNPIEIVGTINGINEDSYDILPNKQLSIDEYDKLNINILENDAIQVPNTYDIKNINYDERSCFDDDFHIFNFDTNIFDNEGFKTLLYDIIPNNKKIIEHYNDELQNSLNYEDVNEVLRRYEIDFNTLTYETAKPIIDILEKNNKKVIDESKIDKNYKKLLVDFNNNSFKKHVKLLNRKLLEEFKEYYGTYPNYDTFVDSTEDRLKWILSQYDNGMLFFNTIILNILTRIFGQKEKSIEYITKQINPIKQKHVLISSSIEIEKNKQVMDQTSDDCPKKRIVKLYYNLIDLENDNDKELSIDADKISVGEHTNIVQDGMYCVLIGKTEDTLYRREVVDKNQKWILQEKGKFSPLIQQNIDFCNQQAISLEKLNRDIFMRGDNCIFSSEENKCINSKLNNYLLEFDELNEKLNNYDKAINILTNADTYLVKLNNTISNLKELLISKKKYDEKVYLKTQREYKKIILEVESNEHKALYNKIDLYLTKINKLEDEEMYQLLKVLLDKYGREANLLEGENPKNIYCKIGHKVLVCKHHEKFIELYQNLEKASELLEYIKQEWGVLQEDKYYCNNCGQELYISNFETVEGFSNSGAHQITTEVMDPDSDEELEERVNETVEELKSNLEASELDNLDSINLLKLFSKLMGLKLSEFDTNYIIKKSNELNTNNIRTKAEWLSTQKRVPKNEDIINKVYNNYIIRNKILNTTAVLFIVLQMSIPGYIITKTHSKCRVSLNGYPLLETAENSGIDYVSCILENLRDTNSYYGSLKKINISDSIRKIIANTVKNDQFIQHKLDEKRKHVMDVHYIANNVENVWNEFKPPLSSKEIELKDINPIEYSEEVKDEYHTKKTLLTLKNIELMNNVINSSEVENKMFDPIPLDNSCCLDKINESYNYLDYMIQNNDTIRLVRDSISQMTHRDTITNTKIITYPKNVKEKIESFSSNIFPQLGDELTTEIINQIFREHITFGKHIGKKYLFDENGLCIITGVYKKDLESKEYTIDDYNLFLKDYNTHKLFNINRHSLPKNIIHELSFLKDSKLFSKNQFITDIIDSLEIIYETDDDSPKSDISDKNTKIQALWDSVSGQISLEINILLENMNTILSERIDENIGIFLSTLGELNDIKDENIDRYGEDTAYKIFYKKKEQLIKQYINRLLYFLNKITVNTSIDEDMISSSIPNNWNIDESYKVNLIKNVIKDYEFIDKIKGKMIDEDYSTFKNVSELINKHLKYLNKIIGKDNIIDCTNDIKHLSELTYKNASVLLQYLFINTLNIILNDSVDISIVSDISNTPSFYKKEDVSEVTPDDPIIYEESDGMETDMVELQMGESSDIEYVINRRKYLIANFIESFVTELSKTQSLFNKYTDKKIKSNIDKIADLEKEENLKVIELLDKEARQSFKAMIAIGVDTWKNLSNKNKELTFKDNIPEDTHLPQSSEDIEAANKQYAIEQLGENYSEEQYRDLIERRNRDLELNRAEFEEREILPDDDGDEDGDGDGYFRDY